MSTITEIRLGDAVYYTAPDASGVWMTHTESGRLLVAPRRSYIDVLTACRVDAVGWRAAENGWRAKLAAHDGGYLRHQIELTRAWLRDRSAELEPIELDLMARVERAMADELARRDVSA